eukprot:XP_020396818.1 uncharacterized protein LOC109940876 [Zea mays]
MSEMKRSIMHLEDTESDEEVDHDMLIMMGEYKKRKNKQYKRRRGSVFGHQKVTAAFRQLAYGVPADYVDEYLRIGESTAIECLRKFVRAVCEVFGPEYMRAPNKADTIRLAQGEAPTVNYTNGGHNYNQGYYLADGIYPTWSTFVKTIKARVNLKDRNFAKAQESQRKDVERAFGVLQARFAVVRVPARMWDEATLRDIMQACIIMHNMIIEDECELGRQEAPYDKGDDDASGWVSHKGTSKFLFFLKKHKEIQNPKLHNQLQRDLVEHLWERKGDQ